MNKFLRYFGGICWLFGFLMACTALPNSPTPLPLLPTPEAMTLPISAWGEVELLAQAESREAPAFLSLANGTIFAWTGSQEGEARHFSRGINGNAQIMALKAFFPMEQRLFSGDEDVLMLWQDRSLTEVDLRLWAAVFSRDGIAEIAPIALTTIPTQRYSSLRISDEVIQVVYSGGLGQVNNLYRLQVDTLGRSYGAEQLRVDADYPALIQTSDAQTVLFWLENESRNVYFGYLGAEGLSNIQAISQLNLPLDSALEDFTVAFDGAYAYLFWQIRALDGKRSILMSVGQLDGIFSSPSPLGLIISPATMPTAFNLSANAAVFSPLAEISWLSPAEAHNNMLPIAVNRGNELGIILFSEGEVVAYQAVVADTLLIGQANLQTFPDGNLALSWSQPTERGYANLFYTHSR